MHALATDELYEDLNDSLPRTYTCFATNKKLVSKTKLIISKNGQSVLIRYLYTSQCDLPVRVFEFGLGHFEDILFQVNSGIYNCVADLKQKINFFFIFFCHKMTATVLSGLI